MYGKEKSSSSANEEMRLEECKTQQEIEKQQERVTSSIRMHVQVQMDSLEFSTEKAFESIDFFFRMLRPICLIT